MRKLVLSLAATPLILGSMAVSAQAADDVATGAAADSGFNIFSDVKFKAELRPRYEFTDHKAISGASSTAVDLNGNLIQRDAGSSFTNRTNLNLTGTLFEVDGLVGTVEVNSVNDFNTLDQQNHQTAAEADVAKMTQANISYTAAGVTGIVGRKTLNLDNQRFIGSVGWKQNFQTLDLAAVAYGIGDFNIIGAYVYGVNAIGDDGYGTRGLVYNGKTASGSTTSAAINASYKIMDPIKLTGYAYLLGSVSDTYGLAATGKVKMGDSAKLNYRAEFAMQTKASLEHTQLGPKSGSDNVNSAYVNLDVGANISGFLVGLNYEVLGANADLDKTSGKSKATGYGSFQTPLATKHKFNGWADQFLATPETGLVDMNIRGGYQFETAGKIIGIYHLFGAAADNKALVAANDIKAGDAYGSEFDIAYSVKLPNVNNVGLLVKGAMYMDDSSNAVTPDDTTLAWVQLDYKFSSK